jgi:hypothetical protein
VQLGGWTEGDPEFQLWNHSGGCSLPLPCFNSCSVQWLEGRPTTHISSSSTGTKWYLLSARRYFQGPSLITRRLLDSYVADPICWPGPVGRSSGATCGVKTIIPIVDRTVSRQLLDVPLPNTAQYRLECLRVRAPGAGDRLIVDRISSAICFASYIMKRS